MKDEGGDPENVERIQRAREAIWQIEELQAGRNDDLTDDEIEEIGILVAREIRGTWTGGYASVHLR